MAQMICKDCGKKYQRKIFYEKHILICSILHLNKKEKELYIEELDEIPSARKMYELLKELTIKCNVLEKKVQELQILKRKRTNVVAILNKFCLRKGDEFYCSLNMLPTWIEVTPSDIETFIIQQQPFIQCLKHIFDRFFQIYEQQNTQPPLPIIQYVENKTRKLYAYYSDNIGWQEWGKKDFIHFLDTIQKKVLNELSEWKKNNSEKAAEDYWGTIYIQTMNKSLISFQSEAVRKQIIYESLHKMPMLSIPS